jgi:nitrate reductase gamma subunit
MAPPEARFQAQRFDLATAMDLLAFTRGPGLHWALVIMLSGFCWRLVTFMLAGTARDEYWARKPFLFRRGDSEVQSYLMHAGLFVVLFGFAPHLLLIRSLLGIGWPALPISIVWFASSVTVLLMLGMLVHRPQRHAVANRLMVVDEYFGWLLVFASLVTGLLAFAHLGGASMLAPYAALLTAHLVSAELLMVWLPFGRLAHLALMPLLRGVFRAQQFWLRLSS